MNDPGALSISQAAAWLGLSEQTFLRHVLPDVGFFMVGSLRRVRRVDLEAWLARQTVTGSATTAAPGRSVPRSTASGTSAAPDSQILERERRLLERAARSSRRSSVARPPTLALVTDKRSEG